MNKIILKSTISIGLAFALMAIGNIALADTVTGNLSTGISGTNGNGMTGVVVSPPIANPGAGVYTSAQSVTLTASGATSIYYTTDGTNPTCSTGNLYSGAISVSSSEAIEAISCYPNNASSTVASYLYGINPPSTVTTNNTGGGNTGGGGGSTSSGGGSGTVGIADFVLLMANWGQTGANNAADFNHDGVVIGIQDFIWLMANWTA
jgi:hypothetical protein